MNKLRKILAFIRALLGFLLNFKKKRLDGKEEENEPVPPASGGQEMFPAIVQPALPSLVPDGIGPAGFVGGPFGGRVGVFGSPVDTLGVRKRSGEKLRQCYRQQLAITAGYSLLLYAAGSCLVKMIGVSFNP